MIQSAPTDIFYLRADDSIALRYEDMIENPPETIVRMAAFLGYTISDSVLACVLKNKDLYLEPG